MAHTAPLRHLRSLFRLHRAAARAGVPVEVLRERTMQRSAAPHPPGLSRRQLLAGTAAGAGILALPRIARGRSAQPAIAIVGGGIAGLSCALALADRGVAAQVFEASDRIGGRMFSHRTGYFDGQVAEWGGELIDSGHETVHRLARRFGLVLDDLLAAQPPGAEDTYFFAGRHYPRSQVEADFAALYPVLVAQLEAAGYPTRHDAHTAAGAALDRTSVFDWIASHVPGGHDAPLGALLDVAYAIEYGADTPEQSALNLLYLLAFQPQEGGFSIFGESDERFHVRGGNQQLPEAIAAHLGPAVVRGQRLVRLTQTPNGRYRLEFERGGQLREVTADQVVLALPFAALAQVELSGAGFDPLKQEAIRSLGRGQNGKLQLQFHERRWNGPGAWPGISTGSSFADTGYQASWDASRAQPGRQGLMVCYSGGSATGRLRTDTPFATARDSSVRIDAEDALRHLEPVFSGLSGQWSGRASLSLFHRSPLAGASYAFYRVGQYTRFGGHEAARQGGVLFCGEHTSTEFQGYMEGAASEGERAATELLALLGRAPRL
jgi:monoamine oxidase